MSFTSSRKETKLNARRNTPERYQGSRLSELSQLLILSESHNPSPNAMASVKEGLLKKSSKENRILGLVQTWQERYFRLRDGQFEWFMDKSSLDNCLGGFRISTVCAVQMHPSKNSRIVELFAHKNKALKTYQLMAESRHEALMWLDAIKSEYNRALAEVEAGVQKKLLNGDIAVAFILPHGGMVTLQCHQDMTGASVKKALFERMSKLLPYSLEAQELYRLWVQVPWDRERHYDLQGDQVICELFLDEVADTLGNTSIFKNCRTRREVLKASIITLDEANELKTRANFWKAVNKEVLQLIGENYRAAGSSEQLQRSRYIKHMCTRNLPVMLPAQLHPEGWTRMVDAGVWQMSAQVSFLNNKLLDPVTVEFHPGEPLQTFKEKVLSAFKNPTTPRKGDIPQGAWDLEYVLKVHGVAAFLDCDDVDPTERRMGDFKVVHDVHAKAEDLHVMLQVKPEEPNEEPALRSVLDKELNKDQKHGGPLASIVKASSEASPSPAPAGPRTSGITPQETLNSTSWGTPNLVKSLSMARRNTRPALKEWNEWESTSMWEDNSNFRLRVCELYGLNLRALEAKKAKVDKHGHGKPAPEGEAATESSGAQVQGTQVQLSLTVVAGLYHGGNLLAMNLEKATSTVLARNHTRFSEWLTFPVSVADLPHATRVCVTVLCHEDGSKGSPLGWVNLLLINHHGHLVQGTISLRLWPNGPANPIATCCENLSKSEPARLFLEFDKYALPVAYPDLGKPVIPVIPKKMEKLAAGTDTATASEAPSAVEESKGSAKESGENGESLLMMGDEWLELEKIINSDPLTMPNEQNKKRLWKHRKKLVKLPQALPKFLLSVNYLDRAMIREMYSLLAQWVPPGPEVALELLGGKFADHKVREYAVECLDAQLTDSKLSDFILQLVQVVKLESYNDSPLARFLLSRSIQSAVIGHQLFWHLKAEMHVPEVKVRFGLMLAEYLKFCGSYREELLKQCQAVEEFQRAAIAIKSIKSADAKLAQLRKDLGEASLPAEFRLPLDPRREVSHIKVEKCKFMDSKKLPLWIVVENTSIGSSPVFIIFKSGDDLRQDMLTLQMIRLMDNLWQQEGLDLCMNPYGCVATGDEQGMIEVVLNSESTSAISKQAGGAAATFQEDPIDKWLRKHNPDEADYNRAVEAFIKSTAGYCVATCVMGIGDRHNDNIMVKRTGELFHIDFGHFLGNFKSKFGFKRERAKFVLTPDFVYVMGGPGSEGFKKFINNCKQAFFILRRSANLIMTLFELMLSAGIPELQHIEDIDYLKYSFLLHLDEDAAGAEFEKWIFESLNCKTTQLNNAIHSMIH